MCVRGFDEVFEIFSLRARQTPDVSAILTRSDGSFSSFSFFFQIFWSGIGISFRRVALHSRATLRADLIYDEL